MNTPTTNDFTAADMASAKAQGFRDGQAAMMSDKAVTAAARTLNIRSADATGVNADDQWAIYGEDFKADARAMLEAAVKATSQQDDSDDFELPAKACDLSGEGSCEVCQ